jgi:hypothetical protein
VLDATLLGLSTPLMPQLRGLGRVVAWTFCVAD